MTFRLVDEWQRSSRTHDRIETLDPSASWPDDSGFGGSVGSKSEAVNGVPGGRSEARSENPGRPEPVVADLVRTQEPTGTIHLSKTDDVESVDITGFPVPPSWHKL